MKVLHVLNGIHTAGIEQLALQLLRHAPPELELAMLNLDAGFQDFRLPFEELISERQLTITDWFPLDGPALALRTARFCSRCRPDDVLLYP